ncbi:MAG: hypothetical protein ACUVQ8_00015 [Nitrososphaeria archaeon]
MAYMLPFKPGMKVIEVGGGDNPLFRPNMYIRQLPTVDVVANLEGRWPIPDESYDGVFGKYVIEHIGWRNVIECYLLEVLPYLLDLTLSSNAGK